MQRLIDEHRETNFNAPDALNVVVEISQRPLLHCVP